MKLLQFSTIVFLVGTWVNAEGAERCSDIFGHVEARLNSSTQYEQDFGAGVFVRKVSNEEFQIEPPPEVVHSARKAQIAIGKRGRKGDELFTVLFSGFSEGEVIAFRSMLHRDAKIAEDDALTAILLEETPSSSRSYEENRERALAARDRMNYRYRWSEAKVEKQLRMTTAREESYLLIAERHQNHDKFLLKLKIRAAKFFKNRTEDITKLLSSSNMVNASTEQMARHMISTLEKEDPGVSAVTLKVISSDFIIAAR